MSRILTTICGLIIAVSASVVLCAQFETSAPRNPDVMPSQFVPPVPRVFQVYGSISTLYRDSVTVVNPNGDSVRVDTIQRRTQTVTMAPSTESNRIGDTLFMYSSLGLLVLDRLETQNDSMPTFSGREAISDTMVNVWRHFGFWMRIDVISSVPDDPNPTVPGPTVMVWPNPFADVVRLRILRGPFTDVETYVYALDGRLITQLPLESSDDEGFQFRWDGKGADGVDVASGTYIVRLLARLPNATQRIGYTAKIMRSR